MLRVRRTRTVGILVSLLLIAAGALLAADPEPGVETDQPYANEKLGLKMAQPPGVTLLFRTTNYARGYLGVPLFEFRVKPQNMAPSLSGALLRVKAREDFKTWLQHRPPTQDSEVPIKETEVLADHTLDIKPGEGWLRDFKFTTDFGTMFERHVYFSDEKGNFYELILSGNIREEEFLRPLMGKITAGLSMTGVGAVGAGDGADKPKPGIGVPGFVFSSPAGREDLFLLKDGETKLVQLTNAPGRDIQPAFSPDGSQIAFVSGRDAEQSNVGALGGIYVMNADGSDVKWVVKNGYAQHPRWSPDGKRLVFDMRSGPENGTIHTVNVDGSDLKTLVGIPGWTCQDPDWSPDGTRVLFNAGSGKTLEGGIYTIKLDGSDKMLVVPMQKINAMGHRARWSPDGKQIIFTSSGAYYSPYPAAGPSEFGPILICNADGSNLHAEHLASDTLPVFMPGMHKIAFAADHGGDGIRARDTNTIDLFVKNIDEVFTVNLTKDTGGIWDFDVSPIASGEPLPKRTLPYDIVFAHDGFGPPGAQTHPGIYDIFVISADGKAFTNITQTNALNSEELNPCWSPDKKRVVFDSRAPYWMDDEREGRYERRNIWVMDADGSHRVNLTKSRDFEEYCPVWSPDGSTIAFFRFSYGGAGGGGLFLMDPTGNDVRHVDGIIVGAYLGQRMTWSNNGQLILVGATRSAPMAFGTVFTAPPVWTSLDKRIGMDPDWNPTSNEIIYAGRNDKGEHLLQRFNFPGGTPVDVLERGSGMHPSWAPDGRRFVFDDGEGGNALLIFDVQSPGDLFNLTAVAGFGGHNVDPDWAACPHAGLHQPGATVCVIICCKEASGYVIYMTRLDGSERKEIGRFNAAKFMSQEPVFSANGKRCAVAYIDGTVAKIQVSDLDGKESKVVAEGTYPQLSPDGLWLSYLHADGLGPAMVYRLDLTQDADPKPRAGKMAGGNGDPYPTAWSPESNAFYFGSDFEQTFVVHIYKLGPGDGQTRVWTIPEGTLLRDLRASPDGRFLYVQCDAVTGGSDIYRVNTDGSGGNKLFSGRFLPVGAFSDDGKRIFTGGGGNITAFDLDGSDPKMLMQGQFNQYHWRARGDIAMLLGNVTSGDQGLITCGADGSNPKYMQNVKGNIVCAIWCGDGSSIPTSIARSGHKSGEDTGKTGDTTPGKKDDPTGGKKDDPTIVKHGEGAVYVCEGPIVTNGRGETTWRPDFSADESQFTFKPEGAKAANSMTWSKPPLTLRVGDVVELRMSSTSNPEGPYIGGHFNINCAGGSDKVEGLNGAGSIPHWRAESPHTGTMRFTFTPDNGLSDPPTIMVSAGNAGGDGGPSSYVWVSWKYEKR